MAYMSYFYIVVNVLMLAYACYSWYWQAKVEFRGHYRISSIRVGSYFYLARFYLELH